MADNYNNFEEGDFEGTGLSKEEIIKMIKTMKMMKSSKVCSICCSEYNQGDLIKRLPCKHIFHETCIVPWLKDKCVCPYCKLDLKEHFENISKE